MSTPVFTLRQNVKFPGNIEATNGIEVTKTNGIWTFETNWNDFGSISAIPTAPTSYVLTFDTATQLYTLCPSHLLGGAVAGIADAPTDGSTYARKNADWITISPGLSDAPSNSTLYGRKDGTWTAVPAAGIADAPSDSTLYGRKNGAWTLVPPAGIADAPTTGGQYARQSGTWTAVASGGIGEAPSTALYGRRSTGWVIIPDPPIGDAPTSGGQYVRQSGNWVLNTSSGGIADAPSDGTQYGRKNGTWTHVPIGVGNIRDYGAIPNDASKAAVNAAAMAAAWADFPIIYVPKGTFYINPVTVPSSAVGIVGDTSTQSILSAAPSGTGAALTFSSSEVYLRDFAVEIPVTSSSTTTGILLQIATKISLIRVRARGYRAIFGLSNTNVTVDDCSVDQWSNLGIAFSNGDTAVIRNCNVAATGFPTLNGHAIIVVNYKRFHATSNLVTSPGAFAIVAGGDDVTTGLVFEEVLINNNVVKGTGRAEAITIGHGAAVNSFQICNNIVDWTTSTDLGITIVADGASVGSGNVGTVKNGLISNNTIKNPHGAAITVWGDVINTSITGNVGTYNFGSNTDENGAAITLIGFSYGAPHRCVVEGNNFNSVTGVEPYVYREQNAGSVPSFNTFGTNYGSPGVTGLYLLIDGNGSITWDGPFVQTSLTVTDITGTPIAGYAASVRTKVNGSKVYAHVIIIVSNNTGASIQMRTNLPVSSLVGCAGSFGDLTDGGVVGTALISGTGVYITPTGGIQNHTYIASFAYDKAV